MSSSERSARLAVTAASRRISGRGNCGKARGERSSGRRGSRLGPEPLSVSAACDWSAPHLFLGCLSDETLMPDSLPSLSSDCCRPDDVSLPEVRFRRKNLDAGSKTRRVLMHSVKPSAIY